MSTMTPDGEAQIYFHLNRQTGITEGPFSMEQLSAMLQEGQLQADSPISAPNALTWCKLSLVLESHGERLFRAESSKGFWAKWFGRKND